MDDHIVGREHPKAIGEHHAVGDQGPGIGRDPRGQRQDGVMHIDHAITIAVDERRQLMHPAAIICVVIGIGLDPFPPRAEQRPLNSVDRRTRHQNIEIADRAPLARRQPRCREGGALQEHDRAADDRQHAPRHFGFPQSGDPLLRRRGARIRQNARGCGRHRLTLKPGRQRADHLFGARHGDQRRPAPRVERSDHRRIAKRTRQQHRIAHTAAHSVSTCAIAASASG